MLIVVSQKHIKEKPLQRPRQSPFLHRLAAFNHKPISDQCSPSYRNQLIDLQNKSIDYFLYDGEHWLLMG